MKGRNLQKDQIKRIERKLIGAARMRVEEIERIADSPTLFAAVRGKIEAGQRGQLSPQFSANQRKFPIWNRQAIAAAVSIFFFVGAISLLGLIKLTRLQIEQVAAPKSPTMLAPIEIEPSAENSNDPDSSQYVKVKSFADESPKFVKQTFPVNKIFKARKSPIKKPVQAKEFLPDQTDAGGKFYRLTFAGNPGEAGEDLQVVRAELSRSALFALGVNLPIENETEKIKTDLLVGTDGIARAIRIVN